MKSLSEEYRKSVEDEGLFGAGVCEICGKKGFHPECEARALELDRKFHATDAELLQQYALHGGYGVLGLDSQASLDGAVAALESYLRRKLECDLAGGIEGRAWWYIPEGWIGMMGFIVEKHGLAIYPLGSGLAAWTSMQYAYAHWRGIFAYLKGPDYVLTSAFPSINRFGNGLVCASATASRGTIAAMSARRLKRYWTSAR